MSTREADHNRGRYYMHTGYVPNPSIEHPSYGAVISHELDQPDSDLEIPPFVSVGGGSVGPGFLGMTYAPFVVDSDGDVRNLQMGMDRGSLDAADGMLARSKRLLSQFSPTRERDRIRPRITPRFSTRRWP